MNIPFHEIRKWFLRTLAFLLVLILLFVLFVWFISPGTTAPILNNNGQIKKNSITVIEEPLINGTKQRLLIRGEDINKPVLLQVHGGPGSPTNPIFYKTGSTLEDVFTVCYWEQRGAGASFSKDISEASITLEQITADGIEVAKYLKEKFKKDKIYIQGHSWGTVVGSHMVQKTPELFYAYLGIGHVAKQLLSEQLSYDFVLKEAKEREDKKAIINLENIGRPPYVPGKENIQALFIERKYIDEYGGGLFYNVNHPEHGNWAIFKTMIFYPSYTLSEKVNYIRGLLLSLDRLWPAVMETNFFEQIPEQKIPVYFFQGRHDFQTTTSVAKAYFDSLQAPVKKYYEFENSAHAPHFEEYEKYRGIILNEVLKGQPY